MSDNIGFKFLYWDDYEIKWDEYGNPTPIFVSGTLEQKIQDNE